MGGLPCCARIVGQHERKLALARGVVARRAHSDALRAAAAMPSAAG